MLPRGTWAGPKSQAGLWLRWTKSLVTSDLCCPPAPVTTFGFVYLKELSLVAQSWDWLTPPVLVPMVNCHNPSGLGPQKCVLLQFWAQKPEIKVWARLAASGAPRRLRLEFLGWHMHPAVGPPPRLCRLLPPCPVPPFLRTLSWVRHANPEWHQHPYLHLQRPYFQISHIRRIRGLGCGHFLGATSILSVN